MLDALRRAFARDALGLPEAMRPQQFLNLLNRLGHPTKTRWNVHLMERAHGAGGVTYLARYLRGGPLKNARLVAYDGDRVTFTSRARQEEADAVGSPLPHGGRCPWRPFCNGGSSCPGAPEARRAVLRAGSRMPAAALTICCTALGQLPLAAPPAPDWQTVCPTGAAHWNGVPAGSAARVWLSVIPRGGAPPPVRAGALAA